MNDSEISKIVTGVTNEIVADKKVVSDIVDDIDTESLSLDFDNIDREDLENGISSEFPVMYAINEEGILCLYKLVDGKFVLDHAVSRESVMDLALDVTGQMVKDDYIDSYSRYLASNGISDTDARRMAEEVTQRMVLAKNPNNYVPTFSNGEINPSLSGNNYNLSGLTYNGTIGENVSNMAQSFVGSGLQYAWGGESLTYGVDCSGFVQQLYKKFGINIPHYSGSQYNACTKISLEQARPGDIAFYGPAGSKHVAIYIGNGKVCGIGGPAGVNIQNYNYRTDFVGFGRVGT